jgi:hypothetical protein
MKQQEQGGSQKQINKTVAPPRSLFKEQVHGRRKTIYKQGPIQNAEQGGRENKVETD